MNLMRIRLIAFMVLLGTLAGAHTAVGGPFLLFSCCGSPQDPLNGPCRYTDRGHTCTFDGDCGTDVGFTICCSQACTT